MNKKHISSAPTNSPTPATGMASPAPVHDLEEVVVRLKCFEPNSKVVELTGDDLCRNTLFVGTVGSGKTTTMNPMLQQMIAYRAQDPAGRMGLLIIDSKMDDTVQKVQHWAATAGRSQDVQILSASSEYYYDFFADLHSFDQLDEFIDKILSTNDWNEVENKYWQEGRKPLLDAAFTLLLCLEGRLNHTSAISFMSDWLMQLEVTPSIREKIKAFQKFAAAADHDIRLPQAARNKIQMALNTINMWEKLDPKTKSNFASVFSNCLSPFSGTAGQAFFNPNGRQPIVLESIIKAGKIVVLSLNAARDPELAKLIGKFIKADFYQIVQSRQIAYNDPGRLVGLILDEYPLVVTSGQGRYGDITQLQSLRSKRAFVMAATQGFISLDMVIGDSARMGLLVNFNNFFFLNCHEPAVDQFALLHFGLKLEPKPNQSKENSFNEYGSDTQERPGNLKQPHTWVCLPGALAKLHTNQAFVSLVREKFTEPLWLEPLYFDQPISPQNKNQTALNISMAVINEIRQQLNEANHHPIQDGMTDLMQMLTPHIEYQPTGQETPCGYETAEDDSDHVDQQADAMASQMTEAEVRKGGIEFTKAEFETLIAPTGMLGRFLAKHPDEAVNLTQPVFTDTPGEIKCVGIPSHWLQPLKKMRATNPVDKEFKKMINTLTAINKPKTVTVRITQNEFYDLMTVDGLLGRFLQDYPNELQNIIWPVFSADNKAASEVAFPWDWVARLLKMKPTGQSDHEFQQRLRENVGKLEQMF